MSFIVSPTPFSLVQITQYEAIAAIAGVSIGDSLSKREVISSTGGNTATTWTNLTTGLPLATPPTTAQVIETSDSTQDSLDSLRTSLERSPEFRLSPALSVQQSFNTVIGVVFTAAIGQISSLYVSNAAAIVGHYIGIVSGNTAPVSGTTALTASFWYPGTVNSQLLIDNNYWKSFAPSTGYSVVRSSTPLIFTQLGAVLADNQLVRATSLV